MNIINHFQNINLTEGQKNALVEIENFLNGDSSVFILKGYAGSGKTTLLKGLIAGLKDSKKTFQVTKLMKSKLN